jgi:transposase
MSMPPKPIGPIPEDAARVAKATFPRGNVYIEMRNVLGTIYDDEDFAELFEVRSPRYRVLEVGSGYGDAVL